jgi:electron transport complex protein RnfB
MNTDETTDRLMERREFLRKGAGGVAGLAVAGTTYLAGSRAVGQEYVWQIDPDVCIRCGACASNCVLELSAVKCVHTYTMCGYCTLCFGYFLPDADVLGTAAENQVCPTGALRRKSIEEPYYEYSIDEPLCVGCAKCVEGCNVFGNGSLHLQVRHDRCLNCNECSIARDCPVDAFRRIPAETPYLFKGQPVAEQVEAEVRWVFPDPASPDCFPDGTPKPPPKGGAGSARP